MKRILLTLVCLLLLTGCSQQPQASQKGAEASPDVSSEVQVITLAVGYQLPLPVTEDSIFDYYESPEGFGRQVLATWGWKEGFCVCSAPISDSDGEATEAKVRFDFIYAQTGYCYILLEGTYDPQEVESASPGSIVLTPADSPLSTISASLSPALVNPGTGEPVSDDHRGSAATVSVIPRMYALEWWPLIPELWDGGPLTIPGGDGDATPQSLNGIYTGADTLDLLFDNLGQGIFPEVQVTYDPDVRELTLLCRDVTLNCQFSGENLYIDSVQAETRGADTAVICTMAAPPVSGSSQYASALQIEQKCLDDLDRNEVLLRLTFHSPVG